MAVNDKRSSLEQLERISGGKTGKTASPELKETIVERRVSSNYGEDVEEDVVKRPSSIASENAPHLVLENKESRGTKEEATSESKSVHEDTQEAESHMLTVDAPKRASSVYSEDLQEKEERAEAVAEASMSQIEEPLESAEDNSGSVETIAPTAETKPMAEEELHEAEDSDQEAADEPEMSQLTNVVNVVEEEAEKAETVPDKVEVDAAELVAADTVFAPTTTAQPDEDEDDEKPILESSTYGAPPITYAERTASPEPQTPTAPVSPLTPREERASTGSFGSIDLSETDLDYDQYSAEQLQEFLATPRASSMRHSAHMRKPSSLEILQNTWAPSRQSTLFDVYKTTPPQTPAEAEAALSHNMGARQSVHFQEPEDISVHKHTVAPSVSLSQPGSMRSVSIDSETPTRQSTSSDEDNNEVDWSQLERNEEQEKTDKELADGAEDESTAFLLARLEQENALLTSNPKATNWDNQRKRSQSRPPSIAHLKKLVNNSHDATSVRYSLVPSMPILEEPPPMTELEFWAALVQDYPSTATRLPTLTTSKIRSGIPPPLRGVVWQSMSGARDKSLEESFDSLVGEKSPYEGIINKDVGRSFPGVELFRDADGEGQKMLGRVLKCFSLHDQNIGYCQGLGFLVGPLLMNMGEREAFCVLVRLMDHYSLQASFLPSLSGLHMRIYQFSALLKQLQPELSEHLTNMGVEPAYLSQWFLSFFAVTCPLPMLFRIYDVIFAEGANETVMRVALALMRRNEQYLMQSHEFEEVMQTLLGRAVWDSYGCNPDELVDDFTSLGNEITHARLAELEKEFESQSNEVVGERAGFLPDVQAAAGRFLGRLWAPSHTPTKSTSTLAPASAEKERASFLRRSPSKQSISTINDGSDGMSSGSASMASTAATEVDHDSQHIRESTADTMSLRSKAESVRTMQSHVPGMSKEDRDLHNQIEDLLTALSEMQREHAMMAAMLQKEREERNDDHRVVKQLVGRLQGADEKTGATTVEERRRTVPPPAKENVSQRRLSHQEAVRPEAKAKDELNDLVERVSERLETNPRFSSSFETKAQLKTTVTRAREQVAVEEARNRDLTARLEDAASMIVAYQGDNDDLRSEVAELRTRVNEEFKERQRLDHTVRELQAQARTIERKERLARAESMTDGTLPTLSKLDTSDTNRRGSMIGAPAGLRELKLGRRDSSSSVRGVFRSTSRGQPSLERERSIEVTSAADPSTSEPTSATSSTTTPGTPTASPQMALPTTPLTPTMPAGGLVVPTPAPGASGFHARSSSLATQAVLATPSHEPAPEEALLLELVNAKTAEAQARQEVDELKRSLAVQKRKQDEALRLALAQAEAAKSETETLRAAQTARLEAIARAEAEARAEKEREEMNSMIASSNSMPGTPGEEGGGGVALSFTPAGSGEGSPPAVPEKDRIEVEKKGAATGGGGGGWFWNRRTASTNQARAATP